MNYCNNRKTNLFVIPIFFIFFAVATLAQGASLHVIIAADTNDASIGKGTKKDMLKLTELFNSVSNHTGMKLNIATFYGNRLKRAYIAAALKRLDAGPDDVVVFHYSGHGSRKRSKDSRWPTMALDTGMDLDWVIEALKKKKCRLFIAMSDSCNSYTDSIFSQHFSLKIPKPESYRKLFGGFRGYIVASASVPGEYAWTNSQYGGKFTHAFLTSLHKNLTTTEPTWQAIMEDAKQVIHVRDNQGKRWEQHPQAEVNVQKVGLHRPVQTPTPLPGIGWGPPVKGTATPNWDDLFPNIISPPKWDQIIPPEKFIQLWNNRYPPGVTPPTWYSPVTNKNPSKDPQTLY